MKKDTSMEDSFAELILSGASYEDILEFYVDHEGPLTVSFELAPALLRALRRQHEEQQTTPTKSEE